MKTLYIHVGYGKTGTTFIQTFFYKNHKKIEDLYYPKTMKNQTRHLQLSSINKPSFDEKEWIKIKEEIDNVDENKILISTEEFIYDKKFHENFNFVKELFSNYQIKIIVTINNYIDMIYKSYLEFIKKHENEYVCNNIFKFIDKFQHNFQYRELERFKDNFENVTTIFYSKNKLLDDFCKVLNLKLPENIESVGKLNPSIGIEYSSYLEELFNTGIKRKDYLKIVSDIFKNNVNYKYNFSNLSPREMINYRIVLVNEIKLYIHRYHPNITKSYLEKIKNEDVTVYKKLFNSEYSPLDKIYYNILESNIDKNKMVIFYIHINNLDYDLILKKLKKFTKNFNVIVTYNTIETDLFVSIFINKIINQAKDELIEENEIEYKKFSNITFIKTDKNKTDIGQKISLLKFLEDNNIEYTDIIFANNNILDSQKFTELINYNFQVSKYFDIQINYIYGKLIKIDSNDIFHKELLHFLKIGMYRINYYYKCNFVILSKKIVEFLFLDNLHIFYNSSIASNNYSFEKIYSLLIPHLNLTSNLQM